MYLHIPGVLGPHELVEARALLEHTQWVDGRKSASGTAQELKRNLQVDFDVHEPATTRLEQLLSASLATHPLLAAWALPRYFVPLRVSRYDVGMTYGPHTDAPVMQAGRGQLTIRTDLALTLFLDDPADYDGGELLLHGHTGSLAIKLPAGHAAVYVPTLVHEVAPVTRGRRHAVVTWMQSLVRGVEQRAMLFDLNRAQHLVAQAAGAQSDAARLLQQTHANLLRLWAET